MQDNFCENLKQLRKSNKLNQEQFAYMLGIKRSTYAHHETHGIPPKYIPLYSEVLSKEFVVKFTELIDKKEIKNTNNNLIENIELIEQSLKRILRILKNEN